MVAVVGAGVMYMDELLVTVEVNGKLTMFTNVKCDTVIWENFVLNFSCIKFPCKNIFVGCGSQQ